MIVLVGSGGMARDYAKVFQALGRPFVVVGRGSESAGAFEEATGIKVLRGGLEEALTSGALGTLTTAVVAVGVDALHDATTRLIEAGFRRVLVEKPAGMNAQQIESLAQLAQMRGARVFVAYNRRFYSSVRQARRMIKEDGGLQSFTFDFTEWGHQIVALTMPEGVKAQWFLGNSSHVVDLAYFLGGRPQTLHALHDGTLDWHPTSSRFAGSGRTDRNVLFSYHANWDSPGRWGVELCTARHRLILRPMESLQIVRKGSVTVEPVESEGGALDKQFKPGLYLQTQAFLEGQEADLCRLSDHATALRDYVAMAGYEFGRTGGN